jgi:hypothetical protein
MKVRNVHERSIAAPPAQVGALIDGLGGPADHLWPRDRWPALRLDGPLAVGTACGHGPIRYKVEAYDPGRRVQFRFERPRGFVGIHGFSVEAGPGGAVLRHELVMTLVGPARLTWPLIFRPLHDALIEDALDRACAALRQPLSAPPWSPWVRTLRRLLRPRRRRAARTAPHP